MRNSRAHAAPPLIIIGLCCAFVPLRQSRRLYHSTVVGSLCQEYPFSFFSTLLLIQNKVAAWAQLFGEDHPRYSVGKGKCGFREVGVRNTRIQLISGILSREQSENETLPLVESATSAQLLLPVIN